MPEISEQTVPSYPVTVWVCGQYEAAEQALRRHVTDVEPYRVSLTRTLIVYRGGAEEGVRVGFANYPRFPEQPADIFAHAVRIARTLLVELCQDSAMVEAPDKTVWLTRDRPEGQK